MQYKPGNVVYLYYKHINKYHEARIAHVNGLSGVNTIVVETKEFAATYDSTTGLEMYTPTSLRGQIVDSMPTEDKNPGNWYFPKDFRW